MARKFKRRLEYIDAMHKLIKQYQMAIKQKVSKIALSIPCPLCLVSGSVCSFCPHYQIAKQGCCTKKIFNSTIIKDQQNRIRTLRIWIKIYEKGENA